KNIGVTHLTNGAFRLHPVEWTSGEAAAVIASLILRDGVRPQPLEVQRELVQAGVPIVWFDDLRPDHAGFAPIQLGAIQGFYPLSSTDLHASPDAPVTRGEAARILTARFGLSSAGGEPRIGDVPKNHPHTAAIAIALEHGWMATDHRNWFHPDLPFY